LDRSLLRVVALLPLLASCALCEQLTADRVVVGTVLQLPELVDPTKIPPVTLAARVEAAVMFGEIVDQNADPEPVSGARVTLFHPLAPEGLRLEEDPEDPGTYRLSSVDDARLVYLPEQEYRLEVDEGGDRYVMRVTLPPEAEGPVVPSGGGKAVPHERDTPFELAHPDPDRLAFLHVARGPDLSSGCSTPVKKKVYSTLPKKASQVLDFIDDDSFWHRDPQVVPAETFAACGLYAVTLSVVSPGYPDTTNLFLGSQLFGGWAGGVLLQVP
jgi:hypothetical protein